jgi:signal transduction histidine kinase
MQVFTSVIVLAIFFMAYIFTDIRDYKERKATSISSLAHIIGTNSISAIQFHRNDEAEKILSEVKNVAPEIISADIFDNRGKLFAGYLKPNAVNFDTSLILKEKGTHFTEKLLFVSDDIISEKELVGRVSLVVELTELAAIKKAKVEMAAILLLAAVCISFLIAMTVHPYISRRLLYLVNTIIQVRKTGNYNNPIADDGKDEISTLIKAFNRLMEEVKESEKRKDEFIGIASHELKTPLTSIKGYLDLLYILEDKQPNQQCVQKALESTHKLMKLIKDLLDVSKIQSGQLQLNITEFNIGELVGETISSFQVLSPVHEIINEDTLNDLMISGDRQKIEQVLINLLSNAVKYSPPETKVIVSARQTDTELIIKVRDYGIGIPGDEVSEIFERFYRTKDSSVHISGLGLGLYICRDILGSHNGKIWVEREEKGSSFYFSLSLKTNITILQSQSVANADLVI